MNHWISYLSGNVPGGIFLYLLVVVVGFMILLFMHRVNDLFTRRHLIIWTIIATTLFSIVYAILWFKNPPHHVLRRYTVVVRNEASPDDWFARYLTDILSEQTRPYLAKYDYYFPDHWFFRGTPVDSATSATFRDRVYRELPVHRVLKGTITRFPKHFKITLELIHYPSRKIVKKVQNEFTVYSISDFLQWTMSEFKGEIPFRELDKRREVSAPDSLIEIIKWHFLRKDYEICRDLIKQSKVALLSDPRYDLWEQFAEIKLAGESKWKSAPANPYSRVLPEWKRRLRSARQQLLDHLRLGNETARTDNLVAESYLWEQEFPTAEIFLEKAYSENPFDIDVLLNLTFLHASRYREFGFRGIQDIYQQIIDICPLEETVLLQWSDKILLGNPAYSAPPKLARERVMKYLEFNPHSYQVWLMLGKIEAQGLSRDKALRAFLKADSISPRNGMVNYNLGALYYDWNKKDLARTYLQQSINYGNYLDAYLYLGVILKEEGRYPEALEKFRYRVAHRQGEDDFYAYQAMKGIQECLEALGQQQSRPE